MIPQYMREFWPSTASYKYLVPNRVHKLVTDGRIKQICSDAQGRMEAYDHPQVFYFNVDGALRAVYAEWPKDGERKLNQLLDQVGELWRWQQTATIDEIYITLITLDI